MAFRCVIKVEGIKGETKLKGAEGFMDVLSFHWGVHNNIKAWENKPTGTATVNDFSIVKRLDPASPDLFSFCAKGKAIPKVEVRLYMAAGGDDAKKLAEYTFEKCYITSVRPGGSEGGDHPLEEVAFNFLKAAYAYGDKNGSFDVGAAGIQGQ